VLDSYATDQFLAQLVERWFAELTNRKLRRSAHRGVTALEGHVRTWINEWNTDPKPFVWAKTADAILDTFAAYCGRINDSRHSRAIRVGGGPGAASFVVAYLSSGESCVELFLSADFRSRRRWFRCWRCRSRRP
jgi:hypothetical protein